MLLVLCDLFDGGTLGVQFLADYALLVRKVIGLLIIGVVMGEHARRIMGWEELVRCRYGKGRRGMQSKTNVRLPMREPQGRSTRSRKLNKRIYQQKVHPTTRTSPQNRQGPKTSMPRLRPTRHPQR